MTGTLPQAEMPRLVVVAAFDPDENGDMQTVSGPAEQQSEERAISAAKALAQKHAAVIAWSREANPALGEYGPPTTLFSHGPVPDME